MLRPIKPTHRREDGSSAMLAWELKAQGERLKEGGNGLSADTDSPQLSLSRGIVKSMILAHPGRDLPGISCCCRNDSEARIQRISAF